MITPAQYWISVGSLGVSLSDELGRNVNLSTSEKTFVCRPFAGAATGGFSLSFSLPRAVKDLKKPPPDTDDDDDDEPGEEFVDDGPAWMVDGGGLIATACDLGMGGAAGGVFVEAGWNEARGS